MVEGVIVCVRGKPQQAKPFHDQGFGPAHSEALAWPSEASGKREPVHSQLLHMPMKATVGQGPTEGVHHGHEGVAVHRT